jgi:hypothetical protein
LFIPLSRFCQYKIGLAKSFQSMDNVYQEAGPGDFMVPGGRLDFFSGCTWLIFKSDGETIFLSF